MAKSLRTWTSRSCNVRVGKLLVKVTRGRVKLTEMGFLWAVAAVASAPPHGKGGKDYRSCIAFASHHQGLTLEEILVLALLLD